LHDHILETVAMENGNREIHRDASLHKSDRQCDCARLDPLFPESKYDARFKVVFEAIRDLMTPPEPKKKRPMGFGPWGDK
jgi:hypothetical protein